MSGRVLLSEKVSPIITCTIHTCTCTVRTCTCTCKHTMYMYMFLCMFHCIHTCTYTCTVYACIHVHVHVYTCCVYMHDVFRHVHVYTLYIHCIVQGVGVGKAEVFVNGHLAATTDEQGMYTLSHITSGSYRLMVCGLQGMRHVQCTEYIHCVYIHVHVHVCTFTFTCYSSRE